MKAAGGQLDLFAMAEEQAAEAQRQALRQASDDEAAGSFRRLALIHKVHGNPPGGVRLAELPEDLWPWCEVFAERGWCHLWNPGGGRVVVEPDYQELNDPDSVRAELASVLRGGAPPAWLAADFTWQFHQHSGNPASVDGVFRVSCLFDLHYHDVDHAATRTEVVTYLREQTVEWYLTGYQQRIGFWTRSYSKDQQKEMVERLVPAVDEGQVEAIVQECVGMDGGRLHLSDMARVFLAKATTAREVKEVLMRCGGMWRPSPQVARSAEPPTRASSPVRFRGRWPVQRRVRRITS